jgi:4'-phosphopantetheinyl transferase
VTTITVAAPPPAGPCAESASASGNVTAGHASGKAIVIVCSTAEVRSSVEFDPDLLSPAETARADNFIDDRDRRDFVAAHILVRLCASRLVGGPPSSFRIHQRCDVCGGPHGRPRVTDRPAIHLSLSHTRGFVAAAAAVQPIGVDVERGDRAVSSRVERLLLTPLERVAVSRAANPDGAVLRMWLRKESLIKLGEATLDTMRQVDLSMLPLTEPRSGVIYSSWRNRWIADWAGTAESGGPIATAMSVARPQFMGLGYRP